MKKIDRLLQKALELEGAADTNEDGFIEALGLLPEAYREQLPGGAYQFNTLQALSDTALTDWATEDF